jgi:hypothetical protein
MAEKIINSKTDFDESRSPSETRLKSKLHLIDSLFEDQRTSERSFELPDYPSKYNFGDDYLFISSQLSNGTHYIAGIPNERTAIGIQARIADSFNGLSTFRALYHQRFVVGFKDLSRRRRNPKSKTRELVASNGEVISRFEGSRGKRDLWGGKVLDSKLQGGLYSWRDYLKEVLDSETNSYDIEIDLENLGLRIYGISNVNEARRVYETTLKVTGFPYAEFKKVGEFNNSLGYCVSLSTCFNAPEFHRKELINVRPFELEKFFDDKNNSPKPNNHVFYSLDSKRKIIFSNDLKPLIGSEMIASTHRRIQSKDQALRTSGLEIITPVSLSGIPDLELPLAGYAIEIDNYRLLGNVTYELIEGEEGSQVKLANLGQARRDIADGYLQALTLFL